MVGVRAGSEQYPGAAVLCTSGAGSGLAGMIRYVGAAADAVRAAHPEVVVGAGRVQAWVVGSGGGDDAEQALADALSDARDRDDCAVLADADALRHVPRHPGVPMLLTPHAGELSAMTGAGRATIEASPLEHARAAAADYGVTVLLKGRHTVVAEPDGRVRVTTSGVPWLATAGAGGCAVRGVRGAAGRRPRPLRRRVGRVVGARCRRTGGREGGPGHGERRGRRAARDPAPPDRLRLGQ